MPDGWIEKRVVRAGEMSPHVGLCLVLEKDGDVEITIEVDGVSLLFEDGRRGLVEFCSIYSGGGQSPKTQKALRNLMKAMEEDNKDDPNGDRTEAKFYPRNKVFHEET